MLKIAKFRYTVCLSIRILCAQLTKAIPFSIKKIFDFPKLHYYKYIITNLNIINRWHSNTHVPYCRLLAWQKAKKSCNSGSRYAISQMPNDKKLQLIQLSSHQQSLGPKHLLILKLNSLECRVLLFNGLFPHLNRVAVG